MLSDGEILKFINWGAIEIQPFDNERLGPASYDLLLDSDVRIVPRTSDILDLTDFKKNYSVLKSLKNDPVILPPGGCMLASTQEIITIDERIGCQIEGRSSMARLFQSVHVTAGWCDPGWSGRVTLEIVNHMPRPVKYHYGMKIAQALFFEMYERCLNPYKISGQYHGQNTVTEANPIKTYNG